MASILSPLAIQKKDGPQALPSSPLGTECPGTHNTPLSRTWEPPPRPKPGRKPATDTPPNKRKAQNRQAQRNFRERRAQKISELEDLMQQRDTDHQEEVEALRHSVDHLKASLESVRAELNHAQELNKTKDDQLARMQKILEEQYGIVPLRPRSTARQANQHSNPVTAESPRPVTETSQSKVEETTECGHCSPSNCACMNEYINSVVTTAEAIPSATAGVPPVNLHDYSQPSAVDQDEMEIDMTTLPKVGAARIESSLKSVTDPAHGLLTPAGDVPTCGFCEDGSFCPCRETHETIEQLNTNTPGAHQPPQQHKTQDEQQQQQQQQQPIERSSGCSGKPGSCSQCQKDPEQREWCVTLANKKRRLGAAVEGCGQANCCQLQTNRAGRMQVGGGTSSQYTPSNGSAAAVSVAFDANPALQPSQPLRAPESEDTMDCATAYSHFKSHPSFRRAMVRRDEWISDLTLPAIAAPSASASASSNGGRAGSGGGGAGQGGSDLPPHATAAAANSPSGAHPLSHYEGRSAYELETAAVMLALNKFSTRF